MNTIAKNTFIAMVSLALFYFIFLESNSFYLSSMSSFSLESKFATTIVPIMGLNALGFLCYPLYSLKLSRRKRRGTALVFAILWIACLVIAATVSSPIAIVGAGYLSFFIMGVLGGNAYFGVAMMLAQSNRLITGVALAHAAGILLHLICFHVPLGRTGDAALLGLGIIAFSLVALFGWPSLRVPHEGAAVDRMGNPIYPRKILDLQGAVAPPNLQEPRGFAIQLVALTILLAVLFNVLNSVTSLGTPWVNQYAEVWPRLVVAVCGVAAGVFFDIDRRRHMGTVVLCVAFLAMAAALAAGSGLNITVCRVVFYAGSGIFAVFYLSLFIWLAAYMRVPQLWAGMGKVISNVVALVVTIPSAALAQANDQALTSLAFVLFAAVLILMTRAGMLTPDYEERISSYSKKSADTEETPDHESAEKPDQPPPRTGFPAKPRGGPCSFLRIIWTHETGKRRSRCSGLGRAAAQARRSRAGRGLAHCSAPSHLAVQEDGHPNAHRPDRAFHRGVAKRRASKGEPRGAAQRGNEERERRRCQRRITQPAKVPHRKRPSPFARNRRIAYAGIWKRCFSSASETFFVCASARSRGCKSVITESIPH